MSMQKLINTPKKMWEWKRNLVSFENYRNYRIRNEG